MPSYTKTVWEDYPSTETPITASNLNKIEDAIDYLFVNGTGGGGESLPVGAEIEFDGSASNIPTGWEKSEDDYNVYSTDEKQIGTWIDGKPVYRKVYQLTTPSTENSWQAMGTTGVNIDTIVDFRGTVLETGQKKYNSINFGEGSYYVHTAIYAGNNRDINMIQKGWSSLPCVITIEYTKTTD